ncbi:MAG: Asp-tRNA(Asn)/Glu-tRNA(Gln) amidotransferase subunit GatC [Candidatus Nanohaloarchaea archaeon]
MVDVEEVRRTAENARIDIDEEEAEEFAEEFEDILEMFEKIEEVDTEGVEPAFHPVDVEPEARDDVKEETLEKDEVFSNTENEEEGFFKGPSA